MACNYFNAPPHVLSTTIPSRFYIGKHLTSGARAEETEHDGTADVYNARQYGPCLTVPAGSSLEPAHLKPRGMQQKGVPRTDIKSIARGAAFIGSLLLLYGLATGYWLSSSAEAVDAAAMRQHSIVGLLGTVLCIVAVAILLRHKS